MKTSIRSLIFLLSTLWALALGSCTTAQAEAYRIPSGHQGSLGLGLRLVLSGSDLAVMPGIHGKLRLNSQDELFGELQFGFFANSGTDYPGSLEVGWQRFFEPEALGGGSFFLSGKLLVGEDTSTPDILVGLRGLAAQNGLLLTGGISTGIQQLALGFSGHKGFFGGPPSDSLGILPVVLDAGLGGAWDRGGLFGRLTMASLVPLFSLEGYFSP